MVHAPDIWQHGNRLCPPVLMRLLLSSADEAVAVQCQLYIFQSGVCCATYRKTNVFKDIENLASMLKFLFHNLLLKESRNQTVQNSFSLCCFCLCKQYFPFSHFIV